MKCNIQHDAQQQAISIVDYKNYFYHFTYKLSNLLTI
jgi:hypothetical protein